MAKIDFHNLDCIEGMKNYPDNYFELAICDPPYGLNMDENAYKNGINCKANGFKAHKQGEWDKAIPTQEYFTELFRVSRNQIIWGANYFTKYLPPSMGWIFWYKMQDNFSFSDGEFAFSSFQKKARIFKYARGNESGFSPKGNQMPNIHPTQKPVGLYKWCLDKFAKEGDKILDTHLGGGSIAIACEEFGYDLTAFEIDEHYYKKANERLELHRRQLKIF